MVYKPFLSGKVSEPSFVATLSSYGGPYTHSEILAIMATPAWTPPDPQCR